MSHKLREAQSASDDTCTLDMSPMIDMVFLLLLFFLVNATLVVVKLDKEVHVPVAVHSRPAEDAKGRIVVNIYKDGDLYTERTELLPDDEAIFQLIKTEKEANDLKGYKSKLHLRGDKEAVFKHCRRVIRIAARAQVDQVVFAVYVTDK
jgi:biopolymer transport protein ExbD